MLIRDAARALATALADQGSTGAVRVELDDAGFDAARRELESELAFMPVPTSVDAASEILVATVGPVSVTVVCTALRRRLKERLDAFVALGKSTHLPFTAEDERKFRAATAKLERELEPKP